MSKRKPSVRKVWPGMSVKQHCGIGRYLGAMAFELGLTEWQVELELEPCEDSCNAQISVTDKALTAVVAVNKSFNELPILEKRQTLIHELLHCHQVRACETIHGSGAPLSTQLGSAAFEQFEYAFDKDQEIMVDNLATVIVRMIDDSSVVKYLEVGK